MPCQLIPAAVAPPLTGRHSHPSFRQFRFSVDSNEGMVVDGWTQHILNATSAGSTANFSVLYDSAGPPYWLNDTSHASLQAAVSRLERSRDAYEAYLTVRHIIGSNIDPRQEVCAMQSVRTQEFAACVGAGQGGHDRGWQLTFYGFVAAFVLSRVRCRRKQPLKTHTDS
jgi:hypothetical protein